jgi:hypothetical protein
MRLVVACALSALLFGQPCFAGVRHFTYLYEAPTAPAGAFELENYATSEWSGGLSDVSFRNELEFGITDHLQAGLYVANWNYVPSPENRVRYRSASLEVIYNLTNPAADPIGVSIYQEVSGGRQRLELETKLIAQKNFGPLILAYNLTLESEWEGESLGESAGELQQAIGASYEISPRLSLGVEMLQETSFPDWQSAGSSTSFFLGPNVSYRSDRWFATVTGLAQATQTGSEPDFQARLIFGVAL